MKLARWTLIALAAVLCGAQPRVGLAQPAGESHRALLEATEPERNFFMKQLGDCPKCKTLTIVVSDEKPDADLLDAFRSVAQRLGKDNAGAVATSFELWKNWKIFADHGCPEMEQISDKYVLHLDRAGSFCGVFPYKNHRHLIAAVSIIERNLKGGQQLSAERWKYMTTVSIDEYLRGSKAAEPFRPVIRGFVEYIAGLLLRDK